MADRGVAIMFFQFGDLGQGGEVAPLVGYHDQIQQSIRFGDFFIKAYRYVHLLGAFA